MKINVFFNDNENALDGIGYYVYNSSCAGASGPYEFEKDATSAADDMIDWML